MVLSTTTLILLACAVVVAGAEERICAFAYQKVHQMAVQHPDDEDAHSTLLKDQVQRSQKCPKDTDFCYALWQEEVIDNRTVIKIVAQGCWEDSGSVDCDRTECISDKKPRKALQLSNSKYCCCSENMCNLNVTDIYVPTSEVPVIIPAILEGKAMQKEMVIIIAASLFSILVIGVLSFVICRIFFCSHKPAPDAVHLMESSLLQHTYSMETLKLSEMIGRGRYGSVWKGTLHDNDVAVKVFPSHHGQYFVNEREIYMLPFMDNSSLLTYYGSDERVTSDGVTEYLLVLSHAPHGSLMEYLQGHALDWPTFCKMSQSISKGLAHLHTDMRKGDILKPSISHRDLNSKNILVKADLSCCLCDLGFAMKIAGSKYYYNGEEQHAETKSLTDVGTLRYMAPEVLEGAVNLRDCESSLKQIDIYSLGLVLWELATRCPDLYERVQALPPHRLPFELEIGLQPNFEQMQALVSHNKARPLFPNTWKEGNPAIHLLKETIEDCWDQDAEARLTALCVEERLQELPALWERLRVIIPGSSPVNPTSDSFTNCFAQVENGRYVQDTNGNGSKGPWVGKDSWDTTASETTAETTVTMSPIESLPDMSVESEPLQPHQGRNPCLERNLIREASEELSCEGNILVEKSSKHSPASGAPGFSDESHALLSHDYLSHQAVPLPSVRAAVFTPPIPYVQNAVFDGSSNALAKQPNVPPGNCPNASAGTLSWELFRGRDYSGWKGFKRLLEGNKKGSSTDRNKQKPTKMCVAAASGNNPAAAIIKGEDSSRAERKRKKKKKRPSSLRLDGQIGKLANGEKEVTKRQSSLEGVKDVFESGGLKNTCNHVKTPHDIKKNRFSLYDDRMMVCAPQVVEGFGTEDVCVTENGSIPARAWYSTSVLADSLCDAENSSMSDSCKKHKQKLGDFGLKPDCRDSLILYDCNVSSF